ncbi:ribbon-helix-helix protein, CopG family [Microbacterium sp. X-17]|uniref:ribbon-helix-helix protein, CopG family n=1 Tax=Microbacterium sp. X-17 TaxID=3144404 RepID=UPI0031F5921A
MPNDAKTPMRSFRISDDLYRAALEKARSEGRSLSEVIRMALDAYIEEDRPR